jgi:chromosome partitioning protein
MFTVSFIGSKGGCGKTTSALGLAVAATRAGQDVALIDLDPQASAANWGCTLSPSEFLIVTACPAFSPSRSR